MKELIINDQKIKVELNDIFSQFTVNDFRDFGIWLANHDTPEEDLFNNMIDFGYGIFCLKCKRFI